MGISYTTCRDCGELLHITNDDTVHPLCTPKPTKVERLTAQWRALAEQHAEDTAEMLELQRRIDELDARPPRLLEAALAYAAWGWPVFPLKAQAKTPATKHGFKDATTDGDRIRAWWTRHPDHNIGLPTGLAFDVVDVDVPQGIWSYDQILIDGLAPDTHGRVCTSRGGIHLYIEPSGDGNRAGIRPGVDLRGVGGYVVAPPSTLGRGRAWAWSQHPSPVIAARAVKARVA